MQSKLIATGSLVLVTALAVGVAVADPQDILEMRAVSKAANLISPEQAVERALAAKPGTMVDTDIDRRLGGGYDYEIEIIDAQGTEWEVDVDAATGEVRHVKRDWDLED